MPAAAIAALRGHVERMLRAHEVAEGECLADASLDRLDLAEMLVAALRYVRHEHPWIGRNGAAIDPPEVDGWEVAFAVDRELPYVEPITFEACVDALVRVKRLAVVEEPCGRVTAMPCAYPYRGWERSDALAGVDLSEAVFGIVAEEGWVANPERRAAGFDAALPGNWDPHGYEELDRRTGARLAEFLLAGYERRGEHAAHRRAAEAFVGFFGAKARLYGLEGAEDAAWNDPFQHGHPWSAYGSDGCGCWGRTHVVVVTAGDRVAYLERVWDVSCE